LLIKLLKEKTKEIEELKLEYNLLNQELSELKPLYKMEENLGNKEKILNVLKSEHLTSNEIAKKLSLSKQDTRTYLQRLKVEDKIKVIGKKGRCLVYTSEKPISIAEKRATPDSLEYDLRYLINLIEKKMSPKDGINLTPDDLINIEKIKKRIVDKKWDDKQRINALNEFLDFENTYKEEINEKLAQLEAKVNYIVSGIEQDTIEQEEDKASISETTSISTRKSDIIYQGRTEAIYKVIIIGDPAVGKRTLLSKFAKNQFEEKYLPTVGVNILKEPINIDENTVVNLMFWVIHGQPQFYMLHRPYFNGADGVILVFDVTRSSTFSNINNWWNSAVKYGLSDVPRILIGNKIDLKDERKIILPMAEHLSEKINAPYFEASAITGENVKLVFQNIAKMVYREKNGEKSEREEEKLKTGKKEKLQEEQKELEVLLKEADLKQQELERTKKEEKRKLQECPITLYQFNNEVGDFEELINESNVKLSELLDDDFILLFIDPQHYRAWLWYGLNTTTRMKFIAAKMAAPIRDKHYNAFKITSVDQDMETRGFKVMLGLEEEIDYSKEQTGPTFKGTTDDLDLLKEMEKNLKTKKRKRENLRKRQRPYTHSSDYDDLFKTIIVGDGGVGKTALASRFSQNYFTEDYKNVIGVDFHVKNISMDTLSGTKKYKLQIWDTGGQERFSSIRPMFYRGSLGAVLAFDLTNHSSFEHLPQWIEEIRANIKTKIPILLVGNKSDLVDIRSVSIKEINQLTIDLNLYYMETSAKTGDSVGDCFYILTCLMIEQGVPEHLIANNTVFPPGQVNLSIPLIRSKPIVASEPQFEFEAPEIELGSPKIMINDSSSFGFIATPPMPSYALNKSSLTKNKELEKDKKIKELKKKNKKKEFK
jgi:small GTP-binding protein